MIELVWGYYALLVIFMATTSNNSVILIVEDDADIRNGVRILLESEGYQVVEADCGAVGMKNFNQDTDLVILDIMLPDVSGLLICEELRKTSNVPILFLTAKALESDKLLGLMSGGDDYLTKPFSYSELLGRVKALLRRYHVYRGKSGSVPVVENEYLEHAGLRINTSVNEVFLHGEEVSLTELEYQILRLLMQHPRKIFSTQNLYESVWNEPFFYNCSGTVVVHIRNLRVKLEKDPRNPEYIKTVWGKGYRFGVVE